MKKLLSSKILLLLIILSFGFWNLDLVSYASFNDVPETDRFYKAIDFVKDNNIVSGYEDGSFKPDNPINRAELLKIIIESKFSDDIIEY